MGIQKLSSETQNRARMGWRHLSPCAANASENHYWMSSVQRPASFYSDIKKKKQCLRQKRHKISYKTAAVSRCVAMVFCSAAVSPLPFPLFPVSL